MGRTVLYGTVAKHDEQLSLDSLATGIYYIEIGNNPEFIYKVIKN